MLIFRIFASPDLTPEYLLIVKAKLAYLAPYHSKLLNAYYLSPFIFHMNPRNSRPNKK